LGGRYRLVALLGRGGMGTVWRAHDELLDRDVAVKEILVPPEFSEEEREVLFQRTMREARAAARLSHPNVVMVYDIVEEEGRPWIIMEFVQSRSLAQVIREEGPLPPRRVAEIGLQVLTALGVAHAAGVLHRDVKPSNVLLREDGRVALTDFGIATLEGDPSLTKSGILLGAPAYIPPERIRGHQGGPESDLWSLAATLYTAVEGRPPYDCGTAMATLTAVVTEEPTAPCLAGPLWPVLNALLRQDPAERIGAVDAQRLLRQVASTTEEEQPEERCDEQRSVSTAATLTADTAASMKRVERTRVLPLPQPLPTPDPEPTLVAEGAPSAAAPAVSDPDPRVEEAGAGSVTETQERVGRRHPMLLAGLAVLVVLVGTLLGLGALRPPEGLRIVQPPIAQPSQEKAPAMSLPANKTPGAPVAPSKQATATEGSPSPTPRTARRSAALPAGFRWYRDQTGFSVAVPDEWRVDRQGQIVYFREPAGSRFLLIDQTDHPKDDPVADWQEQERYRKGSYADYQRVRIVPVDYYRKAADWEFSYAGRDGRVHVLNRGVVTSNDKAYGIYWSTRESQWPDSLRYFEVFTKTFQPAR
jgi:eukaryotic-like serine/threonine-protein kinase